jgi:hypothetical protein
MIRNRRIRRPVAVLLMLAGALAMWLSAATGAGLAVFGLGVALEGMGLVLEHRDGS